MTGRRHLTPEDDALWRKVAASVKPIDRTRTAVAALDAARPGTEDRELRDEAALRSVERLLSKGVGSAAAVGAAGRHEWTVDRGLERRLRRGLAPIEGRIDLHGYTQDEAYRLLLGRLGAAATDGKRCVLVITGKGLFSEDGVRTADPLSGGRGVLRRRFQDWVATPPLSSIVLGAREAHGRHGGSGAFYTFLRRTKKQKA
ncbi:MAG: Smr/MutS family protein [Pseudomonadota bacterium]